MKTCTWVGCRSEAVIEIETKDGDVWANLCSEHNAELDRSVMSFSPPKMISAWIKAKGGAEAAAAAM